MNNIITLDSVFGSFLGVYLAKGNCTCIRVECEDIVSDFTSSVGLTYNTHKRFEKIGNPKNTTTSFQINSCLLSELMISLCGSFQKNIPSFVFGCNKTFISSLL